MANERVWDPPEGESLSSEADNREDSPLQRLAARLLGEGSEPQDYSRAVDRVRCALEVRSAALGRERNQAQVQIEKLLSIPQHGRLLHLRNSKSYRTLALGHLLIERCGEFQETDPPLAADLAVLAVELAAALEPGRYSSGMVEDLKALAWAGRASCHRLRGELEDAAHAMTMANTRLRCGTGDSLLEARVLQVEASLCRTRHSFAEGRRLIDRVVSLCESSGAREKVGRALLIKASLFLDEGNTRGAAFVLRQAARWIGDEDNARLRLGLRHRAIYSFVLQGELRKAQRLLSLSRPLYDQFPELNVQARLCWIEGRIASGQGRRREAEDALMEARWGFEELEMKLDAARVALDLAALLGRLGRFSEMRKMALEALYPFELAGLRQEADRSEALIEQALRRVAKDPGNG